MSSPAAGTFTRLFVVVLALTVFDTALGSSSSAQTPQAPVAPSAFARAWETGTPLTVTGELSVHYMEDFANNRVELVHMVRDVRTGRSFRLRFESAAPPALRSDTVVTVRGRAHESEIFLLADGSGQIATTSTSLATTTAVSGDQSTLVIVANFSDKSVSCSATAVNSLMFTDPLNKSVDDLYRETSVGQLSFSGTVVGPVTLNYASTDECDPAAWADAADAAVPSASPGTYPRKVYVMPGNSCPAAGVGEFGGTQTRAWIFTCDVADVYAHELGHNIGMQHAASPTSEYGDNTDVMGLGQNRLRQNNVAHRRQMGWLPDGQIQTISQDGTYAVAPLEFDPAVAAAPQGLKLFKADTNEHYYLSYRRAIGFDANICCTYLDRLSVHRWAGGDSKTYFLAALADGESYVDTVNGITITQASHSAGSTMARVQFTSSTCSPAPPSTMLAPSPQSGLPGTPLVYTFSLTNNDPGTCASSTFALTRAVPTGWSGTLSPVTLTVAPGTTAQATLTATSAAGSTSGTYGVSVNASDSATPVHAASADAAYAVLLTCVPQAAGATFVPSSQSGMPGTQLNYAVSIANRDGVGCASSTFTLGATLPNGWTGSLSPSTLSLAPGATGTATYSVTSAANAGAASYGVWLNVTDAAQPAHAASSSGVYTVQADTTAPTAPGSLKASAKRRQVQLSWGAASDNVAVAGYRVERNGVVVATAATTSWNDQTVTAGSTYTYAVVAYDAAGNVSPPSNSATVTVTGRGK